jgi:hypothetical protein
MNRAYITINVDKIDTAINNVMNSRRKINITKYFIAVNKLHLKLYL